MNVLSMLLYRPKTAEYHFVQKICHVCRQTAFPGDTVDLKMCP